MATRLFQDGKELSQISNYVFHKGKQHFTEVDGLGGDFSERVPSNKEPDLCTFSVPSRVLPLERNYTLVNDHGKTTIIRITKVNSVPGVLKITAAVDNQDEA